MSEKRLRNIAVYYCQRYLVSGGKLSNHLNKRLYREVTNSEERAGFAEMIPEIVEELSGIGLVNDKEAASARLRTALRSGYASGTAVTVAARNAVVDRDLVENELKIALTEALPELADVDQEGPEAAMEQATLALKRARRGRYRTRPQDEKSRRRDAGWLQRRGFRMDAIRYALNIDPLDE